MLGIRQKLSVGFGGLLFVILIIGIETISQLTELGGSIETLLKENYRSVLACRDMQKALSSMNVGILFTLVGYERQGADLIRENQAVFQKALNFEFQNITLPGEGDKAKAIEKLFSKYKQAVNSSIQPGVSLESRREAYFTHILPLSEKIESTSEEILVINQQNIHDADQRARKKAINARRLMLILLSLGSALAIVFMILIGKWILWPIANLTAFVAEIKSGNLDLVVSSGSKDEIGTLAQSFNDMTAALREYRRTRTAQLINFKQATEQAFKVLPEAVAIVNAEEVVEIASGYATRLFDIRPHQNIRELRLHGIMDLYDEALQSGRISEAQSSRSLVQKFIDGKEHYFRPKAVPILNSYGQTTGVIISLPDVTLEREQNETKRGVLSTVSHQLQTPLTSIRMSLHLLLEERVGTLSEKQADLIAAAKEESDRLHMILEQLLNISRVESGKTEMDIKAVRPHELVEEAVEPFRSSSRDRGITLEIQLPDDLPDVLADPVMIGQVFANLLSNALKYTDPGGLVSISAEASDNFVRFYVADTGRGIPPQYLKKILEHFFRVPGQSTESGLGLGLSIVQEIVEAHGGKVSVKSRESEGSIFEFSLKRADSVVEQEVSHD